MTELHLTEDILDRMVRAVEKEPACRCQKK